MLQYPKKGIHVRTNIRIDISISLLLMATKFGKQPHPGELTQTELIKQVKWSCEITWQPETIIIWQDGDCEITWQAKTIIIWQDGD